MYADITAVLLELDDAVTESKQSVVPAALNVLSGVYTRAALTYNDRSRVNRLPIGELYAKPLGMTVSAVFG